MMTACHDHQILASVRFVNHRVRLTSGGNPPSNNIIKERLFRPFAGWSFTAGSLWKEGA
jgi:hypothetical protein